MILFLATAALAMDRPSNALLDDLDRWEKGMEQTMAGPQGCWDISADVTQIATLHQPPDFFSSARVRTFTSKGTFTARLNNGFWGQIEPVMKPLHEDDTEFMIPVVPLIGEVKTEKGHEDSVSISVSNDSVQISEFLGKSVNLLSQAIDDWAGNTETAVAQWDADLEAVMLLREIPVTEDDKRPITVKVRFPKAGEHADRIDAIWPRIVKIGKWPLRGTLRDAQMHLLSYSHAGMSFPRAESLSLIGGFLGWTMGYEQNIRYTSAVPCSIGPEPEP